LDFKQIQKLVYKEYKENKFEEAFNKGGKELHKSLIQELNKTTLELIKAVNFPNEKADYGDILEIAFIATEVGEAIEHANNLNKEELRFELADIVIRTMNLCNRKGINLEEYILKKNSKNEKRGRLHGR